MRRCYVATLVVVALERGSENVFLLSPSRPTLRDLDSGHYMVPGVSFE